MRKIVLLCIIVSCNQQKPIVDYNRDYTQFQNYSNSRKRNEDIKLFVNNQEKDINKLYKYSEDNIKSITIKKDTIYDNGKMKIKENIFIITK